jgi:hypothetical protein
VMQKDSLCSNVLLSNRHAKKLSEDSEMELMIENLNEDD